MVTGIPATTFNAAGLNPDTVTHNGGTWDTARTERLITNYRVRDELLTGLQERGSIGSVPLALAAPFIGPSAIGLNVLGMASPDAAGRQIDIEAFSPSGERMSWFERNNLSRLTPLDLHGMDYVLRGMLIKPTRP